MENFDSENLENEELEEMHELTEESEMDVEGGASILGSVIKPFKGRLTHHRNVNKGSKNGKIKYKCGNASGELYLGQTVNLGHISIQWNYSKKDRSQIEVICDYKGVGGPSCVLDYYYVGNYGLQYLWCCTIRV